MPQHAPVVIFERYDALPIFDAILDGLDPEAASRNAPWREVVKADPATLGLALESWLSGPLDEADLLIVDDLERILETPSQSDAPTGAWRTIARRCGGAFGFRTRAKRNRGCC